MHLKARFAIATMFSALVLFGCGQGAGVKTDFSDRQIFEGAMFGAGPVANLLAEAREHLSPELYARSPEELNAMADTRAAIIDAIESEHPGFLAEFARAARSGDPARVHGMLLLAASLVREAAGLQIADVKDPNLPTTGRGDPNLPSGMLKDPNLPTTGRGDPNLPSGMLEDPNLPTTGRGDPNLPTGMLKDPNLPTTGRGDPNLPTADLFASRLFTEQLANSIAVTFGQPSGER